MDEAEEVLDVAFPAGDQAMEVMKPGEEPLYLPAPFVSAEQSPILGLASLLLVGSDPLDARTLLRVAR